jgi:hypothetical protein
MSRWRLIDLGPILVRGRTYLLTADPQRPGGRCLTCFLCGHSRAPGQAVGHRSCLRRFAGDRRRALHPDRSL